jgi:hypothetical protein
VVANPPPQPHITSLPTAKIQAFPHILHQN